MQSATQVADDILSEEEARRRELLALARRPSYRQILHDIEGLSRNFQWRREVITAPPDDNDSSAILEASTSDRNQPLDSRSADVSPNEATSSSGSTSPSYSENAATILPKNLSMRLDGGMPSNGVNLDDLSSPAALIRFPQQAQQQMQNEAANVPLLLPLNADLLSLKALTDLSALHGAAVAAAVQRSSPPALSVDTALLMPTTPALSAASQLPSPPATDRDAATKRLIAAGVAARVSTGRPAGCGEDVQRKREVRLLKNREAAKECRRKKKEYIKCLENRVNTLEHQNTQLIEELKNLKALYCRKPD